nr:unnamed protein product [Callosobruchus analis]
MIPPSNDVSVESHAKMHFSSSFLAICVLSLILSRHFVQTDDSGEESASMEESGSESSESETIEETVMLAEDDEVVMT